MCVPHRAGSLAVPLSASFSVSGAGPGTKDLQHLAFTPKITSVQN